MGNRSATWIVALFAAGLILPFGIVIVIMTAVQDDVDDCAPDAGITASGFSGPISEPVEGQIGVAQANIPTRSGMDGFRRSMPRVLSSSPDFVSLNEQGGRSLGQIEAAAPGYEAYRDPNVKGQVASTVVMWDTTRWNQVDAGRVLMVPQGPQKWDAGRSATYVTARGPGGAVVSAVSVHHMVNPGKWGPNLPLRQRIYGAGMDKLTGLVKELEARGPVFVAGDMNTHDEQRNQPWSAAAKMRGAGYGYKNHSVDFVFYPQGGGVRPAGSWSGPMVSDHDWVAARFNMNGAGATATSETASTSPGTGSDTSRVAAASAARSGRAGSAASAGSPGLASGTPQTVAGLDPEQTRNAATIVAVGRELGVPERGLVVALATAMQESGIRNLDYGDRDSLGLFQQRPVSGWGTPAEIRDPVASTQAFFGEANHTPNPGLLDIAGWETMPVTVAAQTVQRSAYPEAYADDEDLARKILTQLDPGAAATMAAATESSYCAQGAVPISQGTCPATDSTAEEGLSPDALMVLRCVEGTFGPHVYGGVGDRAANPSSDHPSGKAVDVMIEDWSSADGVADGDAIAAWLQQNHQAFGITYLIWRDRIWSPGDEGWRPYSHPSGATDPTSLHMDHVHISVEGNAGTGLSGGVVSLPLPAGTYTDQTNWRETGAYWSNFHSGNDLSAPCGIPVLAVHSGTVVIERDQAWSGPWLVKITQGPDTVTTWYAHMESVTVEAGTTLTAGQQIGTVGQEGNSSGCHLHLELHTRNGDIYDADNTDPMPWIQSQLGRTPAGVIPANG